MVRKRTDAVADDDGKDDKDDRPTRNRRAFEEGAEEGTGRRSRDDSPRRSRRRDEDDGDDRETRRSRRSRDDDDNEDDERQTLRDHAVGTGWDSYKKQKAEVGDFPDEFKVEKEEKYVVRFPENEPCATYKQHWIERPGKKSWTCIGENCPLCDILGDKPRVLVVFNVIDMGYNGARRDPSDPSLKIWIVGTRVAEQLKDLSKDDKSGPLTDFYYVVSKSGKQQKTAYNISPIKERDLKDDWGIDALTDDELDDFEGQCYDSSVVQVQTRKQLLEIAEEAAGD